MSALGHKRTFAVQNGMSALPPKADMCSALPYVRFVPIADIGQVSLFLRLWVKSVDDAAVRDQAVQARGGSPHWKSALTPQQKADPFPRSGKLH